MGQRPGLSSGTLLFAQDRHRAAGLMLLAMLVALAARSAASECSHPSGTRACARHWSPAGGAGHAGTSPRDPLNHQKLPLRSKDTVGGRGRACGLTGAGASAEDIPGARLAPLEGKEQPCQEHRRVAGLVRPRSCTGHSE